MHELALARAVVATAERHAGGHRVTSISLRIGALRQVGADPLELYVGLVGRGTICDGAELRIERVPAMLTCCTEWEAPGFRCPVCGEAGTVVSGEEFDID